jgi:benzoylformate decarboxylase
VTGDPVTGADWLLAALAEQGVPVLFGNPGSTELPITDALGRQGAVRYVLGLHEAAVIGMADGYAQAGGRLAAANVHVQPGLANAMSGILNAARCRVPMIVTVGQQVLEMLPSRPFLGGELVAMAEPVAKAARQTDRAEDLAADLAWAARTALEHPRGPVVLALPLDVQVAPAPAPYRRAELAPAPPPDPGALDRAAAALEGAAAPVLVAGDGVVHAGASGAMAALAERLGAPIHGEPVPALAPVRGDHPLWRGPLPPFAAQIAPILARHDAVLAVGMPVFRLFGSSPGPALPHGTTLLHMEVDPQEIGRVHPPEVGMAGDPAAGLAGLLERLGPITPAASERRAREVVAAEEARRAARARLEKEAGGPRVAPADLALAVGAAVGPDDLVVDEALTSGRSLRTALPPRTPDTWLGHRGSALGWGLPAAVGAAIALPDRRVMALHGDGSLLFGISALWSAAHECVPLAVVVADNRGYEILRAGLEGMTGRPEGDWPGLAIRGPELGLTAICRGFGASAAHVATTAELPDALDDLWRRAEHGPAVLVVAVEGRTPAVGYPLEAPAP